MTARYEVIEHNGKLAIYHLTLTLRDRPAYADHIFLSDIPAERYRGIIGHTVWFPSGFVGRGTVRNEWGGELTIDASDWHSTDVEHEIPKPRNGKEYTWKWAGSMGQWIKDYYPRCEECGKFHGPELVYCPECWTCHKPGKHIEECAK